MRVHVRTDGPASHGVVRHARSLEAALGGVALAGADVVLAQFTDGLWGARIDEAATTFEGWVRSTGLPVVTVLHDVPGLDPDPARDARRLAGYRRVAAASAAVVVSAGHEARSLQVPRATVIALPLPHLTAPGPAPVWADEPTVGVLGFVYPGKGHAQALARVAACAPGVTVVALGTASPGHEDLVDELDKQAADAGIRFVVTGALAEADLHAAARAVTVPYACYRTLGASASIRTWLAAGRRPLVSADPDTASLLEQAPGSLMVDVDLADALEDPTSTWLTAPVPRADVAAAHAAVLRSVLR